MRAKVSSRVMTAIGSTTISEVIGPSPWRIALTFLRGTGTNPYFSPDPSLVNGGGLAGQDASFPVTLYRHGEIVQQAWNAIANTGGLTYSWIETYLVPSSVDEDTMRTLMYLRRRRSSRVFGVLAPNSASQVLSPTETRVCIRFGGATGQVPYWSTQSFTADGQGIQGFLGTGELYREVHGDIVRWPWFVRSGVPVQTAVMETLAERWPEPPIPAWARL